ncbi:MAG: phosphate ABC transporter substrate-binding protein [marine bacterium B5-7]|nr:MAG: phosphate ABC transporter substrate-binding protein [marine bacterium B5-7]
MYELPETRLDHDKFFQVVRRKLIRRGVQRLPDTLDHAEENYASWLDPDLLLSQTCGYPLTTKLHNKVQLVGTPCYGVDGCEGHFYRSWLITRENEYGTSLDDFRGRTLAINSRDSLSGYNVLKFLLSENESMENIFSKIIVTGKHEQSIKTVSSGAADIAAIDCVTFGLIKHYRPEEIDDIRIFAQGPLLPGLPLITSRRTMADDIEHLIEAFATAVTDTSISKEVKRLMLSDIARTQPDDYQIIATLNKQGES